MLGESLSHIEPHLDNVENNKPLSSLGKTRQALLKKGGRKLRSTTSGLQRTHQQPHQKTQRNNLTRLVDINNNVAASKATSPELATNRTQATVLTRHHIKQGTKKELLKSKSGRLERATTPSDQSVHNLDRLGQAAQNLNTRSQRSRHVNAPCNAPSVQKYDNSCHPKPNSAPFKLLRREEKNPFNSVDNVKIVNVSPAELVPEDELKDGEKIYAGAKFSEPPSPSVLPKPPSHWVGETAPQHSDPSREQITFHLKSLLKVQDLN